LSICFDSFQNVIAGVESLINDSTLFLQNKSRLAYLKAFAVGHIFPVDSLLKSFTVILKTYNDDREILKIANVYIDFIEKNKPMFTNKTFALEQPKLSAVDLRQIKQREIRPQSALDTIAHKIGTFIDYELPAVEPYYFVVCIDDVKINLSSARYGIGQFIRTQFPRRGYVHDLSELIIRIN
jgi:hypothetical protein